MGSTLTPQRERFCQLVAEGRKLTEAYQQAFKTDNAKQHNIHKRASALANHPVVAARIEALREPVVLAARLSLTEHLDSLLRLRDAAVAAGNYSAAVAAEAARGKAAGLYKPREGWEGEVPTIVLNVGGVPIDPKQLGW